MKTIPLARAARRALRNGLLLAALLGLSPFAEASEVVARVGETEVTLGEVQALLSGLDPAVRAQVENDRQALEKLVRTYAAQAAVFKEARGKKWDQRPDIRARAAQASREAVVRSYLASITTPPDDYPPDADVQTFYEQNRERFMKPRTYHLASIYVPSPAQGDAEAVEAARKKAAAIVAKARAEGADFAALANSNATDPGRNDGGDLGFLTEEDLQPESRKVVLSMSDGDVSDPIPTPTGFHILHLIETKPPSERPLREVSTQIRAFLRQGRQEKLAQEYLAKLLEANPVSINEITLEKATAEPKK